MKKIRLGYLTLLCAAILPISSVKAQRFSDQKHPKQFGLGIVLGEPTGISPKLWLSKEAAIDLGLTYSFSEFFLIYGDFLWHAPELLQKLIPEVKNVYPYIGIGGGIQISSEKDPDPGDEKTLGFLRIPLGAEWKPQSPPIGVFLEVAPGMSIAPKVSALIQGGIGIRYYF